MNKQFTSQLEEFVSDLKIMIFNTLDASYRIGRQKAPKEFGCIVNMLSNAGLVEQSFEPDKSKREPAIAFYTITDSGRRFYEQLKKYLKK